MEMRRITIQMEVCLVNWIRTVKLKPIRIKLEINRTTQVKIKLEMNLIKASMKKELNPLQEYHIEQLQ